MRNRDERFNGQGKHKAKDEPLYDKQPTGQAKALKRFAPRDLRFKDDNTCICPAGQTLTSFGSIYTTATGQRYQLYAAQEADCQSCNRRSQCLKNPHSPRAKPVTHFEPKASDPNHPSERMRRAIDSPQGRRLYSQRIDTVEPDVRQYPAQQAACATETARAREDQPAVAHVLHGAQHREASQQRVEAVSVAQSTQNAAQRLKTAPSIGKNNAKSGL